MSIFTTLLALSITVQAPQLPSGGDTTFVERQVTVGSGEWALPGVLAIPSAPGRHPAALLLHGSGPGPADNLKAEAQELARRGIVTLRYTKRSTAHATKFRALGRRATIAEEHLDDALLGVALLQALPEVDVTRIHVVGHSQSTSVAPVVAERVPSVAGVALVAVSSRTAADMIESQVQYTRSLGASDSASERRTGEMLAEVARLRDPATPDSATVLGMPMTYWRDTTTKFTERRVAGLLRRGARVLVVHGGRDYLVTDEDFAAWRKAFEGTRGFTARRFADLNHMMQAGVGRMRPEEYAERRPLSPVYAEALAEWIKGSDRGG